MHTQHSELQLLKDTSIKRSSRLERGRGLAIELTDTCISKAMDSGPLVGLEPLCGSLPSLGCSYLQNSVAGFLEEDLSTGWHPIIVSQCETIKVTLGVL